ncbi:MAG: hypothetical protein AAF567_02450 [Actinomycetota bacterium]
MSMTTTPTDPSVRTDVDTPDLAGAERGLKFAAAFTVVSGLFFAVASTATTDDGVRLLLDIVFFRPGDGPDALMEGHHLANAILGGVMAGWGVMVWLLADRFVRSHPADVKHIVGVGILVWFVVDSAGSIASGGWLNAVVNVGYAALFVLPLRKL